MKALVVGGDNEIGKELINKLKVERKGVGNNWYEDGMDEKNENGETNFCLVHGRRVSKVVGLVPPLRNILHI